MQLIDFVIGFSWLFIVTLIIFLIDYGFRRK